MANVQTLKAKRRIVKSQLTKFQTFLDKYTEESSQQLEVRLEKAENLWKQYDEIQTSIEVEDENEDDDREVFQEAYFASISKARELVKREITTNMLNTSGSAPSISQSTASAHVRLPTLNLPTFSGSYSEWLAFRDAFTSIIHTNDGLLEIQKFQYLRGAVQGEALQLIQTLDTTPENYTVAWKLLEDRFENERLIINTHMKKLFDLPTISKESHTALRQLLDNIRTNISALKSLKEPTDQWSTILIYLFCNKLDWRNRQLWQERLADMGRKKKPTLEEFLNFLTSRCQTLEMSERESRTETVKKTNTNFKKNIVVAATTTHTCEFCKQAHYIYKCDKFCKLSPQNRQEEVIKLKLCFNCLKPGHFGRDCNSSTCRKCSKRHNTLLHQDQEVESSNNTDLRPETKETVQTTAVAHCLQPVNQQILLSTAVVEIIDKQGNKHDLRALLDSGSQSNFVTRNVVQRLKLACEEIDCPIAGINKQLTNISQQTCINVRSKYNNFEAKLNCLILPVITDKIPQTPINRSQLNIPNNITLADPKFDTPSTIDLLIGSQTFWRLLCIGQIQLAKDQPILHKTQLGWIVAGPITTWHQSSKGTLVSYLTTTKGDLDIQLERFWKVEEAPEKRKWTSEEHICEEKFIQSVSRERDGRFIVGLPKKQNMTLGNSYDGALKRFYTLENRMKHNSNLNEQYINFMKQYQELNHMTQVQRDADEDDEKNFYLPHHPVIKEDSLTTKLRVVFDGSYKTTTGTSLNDCLLVGPTIQEDLFSIILRFRSHKYVLTADIAMMYRQINVREEDRRFQKIIWRETTDASINTYNLNTVTYGTTSAPFLAARTLKQLAEEDGHQFPIAKKVLERDFYMDDVLTGADTVEQAIELQKQLSQLLEKGKFELRKWRTNHEDILQHLSEEGKTNEMLILNKEEILKTLGIVWNSLSDTIQYTIHINEDMKVTKRIILSHISKIFDPLGLIGPVMIKAKVIMQQLWQLNIQWDESVPQSVYTTWMTFRKSLSSINDLKVPRCISLNSQNGQLEIHGFCDASETAYGACIYATCSDTDGKRASYLICSKSKVAPLKSISLPKLELCGALVLAKLATVTYQALSDKVQGIYLWCDSTIVLSWLKIPPNQLKTFVANRVSEINQLTSNISWNHVNSAENPADIISRGLSAEELLSNKLWWFGPQWLKTNEWPEQNYEELPVEIEVKPILSMLTTKENFSILTKYSSFQKLQRVIAYCFRYINNTRKHAAKTINELTVEEIDKATKAIIKLIQEESFEQEIKELSKHGHVNKASKLANLNPFLDTNDLIRVGGRLEKSDISPDHKHPYVLPGKHHVTTSIIRDTHKRLHHCGNEQLLATIRLQFWPLSGRQAVKRVTRTCYQCFRFKPKEANHIMGNLPSSRTCASVRPFTITGVDYAGPIQVRESKRRGRIHITKAYIAVFVCFSTKSVHLELVSDLTADAFIGTLRRFTARRGVCTEIYSDNATNFVGSNTKLTEMYEFLLKNETCIRNELATRRIQWNFIPPRAPHFGGLWEAAVKATKSHLYKVIQNSILTFEELSTLLAEIEAVLNSRPLVPLSSSPNDLTPLTPSHFLIGDSLTEPIDSIYTNVPDNKLSRWQHIQKLKQNFWQRWSKEYLHQLQTRGSGINPCATSMSAPW